jgi:ubiquinone/menaquinone biosynthesis C-methylase UbiE
MKFANQIEYWNTVSKEKEFTTSIDVKLISDHIKTDSLIVDYGCGYGRILDELYSHGFKNSIGFDFASDMIERGKTEFPYLNLKTSRNNRIDCDSNSVDLVILFAVLTCIIDNEMQKELMNEIKRVLKPGGLIYINDFLVNSDERNVDRYNKFANKYGTYGVFELTEGAILRHHEENWISELTKDFFKETYKKVKFKTMNGNISNGFIFIGRKNDK